MWLKQFTEGFSVALPGVICHIWFHLFHPKKQGLPLYVTHRTGSDCCSINSNKHFFPPWDSIRVFESNHIFQCSVSLFSICIFPLSLCPKLSPFLIAVPGPGISSAFLGGKQMKKLWKNSSVFWGRKPNMDMREHVIMNLSLLREQCQLGSHNLQCILITEWYWGA